MQQQIPKPSFKVYTGKQNAQVRRFIVLLILLIGEMRIEENFVLYT